MGGGKCGWVTGGWILSIVKVARWVGEWIRVVRSLAVYIWGLCDGCEKMMKNGQVLAGPRN